MIKILLGHPLTRPLVRPGTGCNFFSLGSALISRQFKPLRGASQVVLVVKNPPASAGDKRDTGSISGSGRSPGGGHGNPLQCSCLKDPMDGGGGWQATVHGVTKSHIQLKRLSRHWGYQDGIPAWGLGLPASRSPRSQRRDHDSAQGSGSVAARWGARVSSSLPGSPCSPVPCLAAPLEPTLKNGCSSKS